MKPDDNRRMLRFVRNCSPYRSGERAAFKPDAAAKLIARGLAVYDKPADEINDLTDEEKAAIATSTLTTDPVADEGEGTDETENNGNGDDESNDTDGSSEDDASGAEEGDGDEDADDKPKKRKAAKRKAGKRKRAKLDD